MPALTAYEPALLLALCLISITALVAVFARDPARRAAALIVLQLLLRHNLARPPADSSRSSTRRASPSSEESDGEVKE
jgi:hypothetical protein